MAISDKFRDDIVKEINFVVKKMKEVKNAEISLYYFSAIYGLLQRIFNIEYDAEFIFYHFILNSTYSAFNQRLQALTKGGENTVPLTDIQFEKLISYSNQLAQKIKNKENADEILKKFIILAYSTTGNGHYLFQKGKLKLAP